MKWQILLLIGLLYLSPVTADTTFYEGDYFMLKEEPVVTPAEEEVTPTTGGGGGGAAEIINISALEIPEVLEKKETQYLLIAICITTLYLIRNKLFPIRIRKKEDKKKNVKRKT